MKGLSLTFATITADRKRRVRALIGSGRAQKGGLALLVMAGAGLFFLADVGWEGPAFASPARAAAQQGSAAGLPASRLLAAVAPADEANPAKPFHLAALDGVSRERAETCLAEAIYYEAATEGEDGQRAVAQVVLNRVRHAAFPSSVCGVVYQGSTRQTGCQFTFTCDGSLQRRPSRSGWARAIGVARDALQGAVFAPVGFATHYHASWMLPYWASSVALVGRIGGHVFYTWKGPAGSAGAFTQAYSGVEPTATRLAQVDDEAPAPETAPGLQGLELAGLEKSEDELLADPANAELLNFRSPSQDRSATKTDEQQVVRSIQTALE